MGFLKPPLEGKGGQDGMSDGGPVDWAQAGLEDAPVWLRRMARSITASKKVFMAAGARGKLRCAFKTEVFQVQIQERFPRWSPARHFAIAVGTWCEVEENFENRLCRARARLGSRSRLRLGCRITAPGVRLAAARGTGPPARDCQAQGGDNPMLTCLWWRGCRDPEGWAGGTASSSEDLE